jgi:hypothetical protein
MSVNELLAYAIGLISVLVLLRTAWREITK